MNKKICWVCNKEATLFVEKVKVIVDLTKQDHPRTIHMSEHSEYVCDECIGRDIITKIQKQRMGG